jgi:DNA invertase Pin-like site-specific DNA recombinase
MLTQGLEARQMKTYDELIRVSKMGERLEGDGSTHTITDQRRANREVAKHHGARIGRTFKMLDESGFTILPKIQKEVVERVRTGESDGLVVPYSDRLARNWWDGGAFFTAMAEVNADLWDATMPDTDYRSDEGRAIWGMKMVTNEMPSLAAKRRGNRLADDLVKLGIPNRVPYGYRRNADEQGVRTDAKREAKALVPDETHAPIVRRIFALRLDGHKLASIVDTLDRAGVPSPRGGKWTHQTIEGILRNETYTGAVVLGARTREDAHQALVSKAEWRRVQKNDWTVTYSGTYKTGIAGGIVRCSGCARPLAVAGHADRLTYSCRRRQTTKGRCPRPVHVSKAAADQYVEDAVLDALAGGTLDLIAGARELDAAKVARDRAVAERKAVVSMKSVLDEDFADAYEAAKEAAAHAEHVYDDLLAQTAEVAALPADEDAFDALDFEEQRRVARSLIARVVVEPPLARGRGVPVEDRFTLDWAHRGNGASAGR